MKKEYKKPEMVSIEVLGEELMNTTSTLQMGGTTNHFDASQRLIIYEDEDVLCDDDETIW